MRARLKSFLDNIALITTNPLSTKATVPARLLARLLRSIYLTEVLPRQDPVAEKAGPNEGYVTHAQFSYGRSLENLTRPETRDGHLD